MAENTDVVVTLQQQYPGYMPGDSVSVTAEKAEKLIASGVAVAHVAATEAHAAFVAKGGTDGDQREAKRLADTVAPPEPIALVEVAPVVEVVPEAPVAESVEAPVNRAVRRSPVVK